MNTEKLPAIFCPKCNPHTVHEQVYPTWVRKEPCMIECEYCGHSWHSQTDLDPVCQEEGFKKLKLQISATLMAHLQVSESGTIEANPAIHALAKQLYPQQQLSHQPSDAVAEMLHVINLAQAELRAMYKRLGFNGSNVLDLLDQALSKHKQQLSQTKEV